MSTVEGSIESLSRAILGEAQAEIEDLTGRAQAQADAILGRARSQAEQQKTEILERARQEARRLKGQAAATTHLKTRTLELEHREQLLQKVFEAAAARLQDLAARKDYSDSVANLLREALDQLRSGAAVVRADRATRAILTKAVLERVARDSGVEVQMGDDLESGVGVVAQSTDGRLQFDNTLENRLNRMQAALRADVFRVLTGEKQ